MGSLCISPLPSQIKRWKSIRPSDSGMACPLGLKITKDTAVMSSDIYQRGRTLCLTLRLSPRCVHCRLLSSRRDLSPLPSNTKGRLCQFPKCNQQRWQDVGIFCLHHYGNWGWLSDNWKIRSVPDVPRGFVENVLTYSTNFATKQYQWTNHRDLAAIIPVLLDTSPDAPTLYALDTEFCRLESGRFKMTEAAIIDVKASRIAVSAVLDERRAVEVSTKLGKFLKAQQQDPSAPRHVSTTYSVAGMASQIRGLPVQRERFFCRV